MARYTLDDIRKRQTALQKKLRNSEKNVRSSFGDLSLRPKKKQTAVNRFVSGVQNASFFLDAAFLGYKLYRTFSKKKCR